jgi:O-antigen ligase
MPRWSLLGLTAGLAVVILTASRATIAFAGVGLVLTLLLSLVVRFTSRKMAVGVASIFLLAGAIPLAYFTLEQRLAAQNTSFLSEDMEREAFKKAADAMIEAYPFGVGPNHYVFVANTEGFSARGGVAWNPGSRSTNVHNSYLLVWAETGLFGILTFVVLYASAIILALRGAFRYRKRPGSELLIGLGAGLIAVALHSFFEWMFVIGPVQYAYAGSLGLIAGVLARYRAEARQAWHQQRQIATRRDDENRIRGGLSVA